jgi:hypothetical protein
MAAVSWNAAWRAWFEESMAHEHGLRPVHAKYPERITEKVTQTKLPGITAENAFSYAIDIGCVEPEHPYVRDFLAWTIQMSEAMLGDTPRWVTQWTVLMHAKRRLVRAVLALAHGMRDNAEPDAALLKATRDDAMTAFDEATGENWDEGAQSDYLGSIQLCLMEGEVTIAAQMLRCNRRFAPTQEWYDWLAGLVANIAASGNGRLTDAAAIQAFDGLFDLVREPRYKSRRGKGQYMVISRSFLRLQLAILRHKYIEDGPVAGCWGQILQSIAA